MLQRAAPVLHRRTGTAFLPKFDVLRQLLAAGGLGDVTAVVADFGEWFSANHRIHRPELAGGPMLDLGTYLISFVLDVLGPPDHIIASGTTTSTGVMGQCVGDCRACGHNPEPALAEGVRRVS